ncbi:MAG TPA: hypothetical protein VGM90_01245 [Kofleriaceae bacterium]
MPVAALVIGIIGLIVSIVPFFGMYALPLTILAVILGFFGMRKAQGKGLATAGLVLGIIGSGLGGWWIHATHVAQAELAKMETTPGSSAQ